jgi:hypothetical protein
LAFAFLLSLAFVSAQWAIGQSLAGTPAIYNLTHWVGIGIIPNATLDVVNWSRMQGLRVHSLIVDGSVGVGVINPQQKLEVAGNISASGFCLGSSCITSWPTSYWAASGNDIYNTNSGRVGIGINNPSQKLDVNGYVKAQGFCIGSDCRTSWPSGSIQVSKVYNTCTGSGNTLGCNVSCGTGKKVLGGGCYCYGSYNSVSSIYSAPNDSLTSWECSCDFEEIGILTVRAYAVCA